MPNLKILYSRRDKPQSRNQEVPVNPALYLCLLIESVGLVLNILNILQKYYGQSKAHEGIDLDKSIEYTYILMSLPLIMKTVGLLRSSFQLQKVEEAANEYVWWFTFLISLRLIMVFWICLNLYFNAVNYMAKLVWQIDPQSNEYTRLLSLLQLYSLININQIAICYWLLQWACELTQQVIDLMPDLRKRKARSLYLHQQPQDSDFDIEKVGLLQDQNRVKAKSKSHGKSKKQLPVIII